MARHPQRPHFSDYINELITEWTPLAGDRKFAEDAALQAGFGRFNGQSVAILGQEKGSTTESRLKHNFGMARPEGYRKAVRIMDMADRFDIPLISFVDTAGAYPGIGAEERGQAEAIARSTEKLPRTGRAQPRDHHRRGRLGRRDRHCHRQPRADARERHLLGDLARGRAPRSCGATRREAQDAANNMKITATDLIGFGVIDGIIPEPAGGAHRHHAAGDGSTRATPSRKFLADFPGSRGRLEIREHRREKFLAIGTNLS